MNTFVRGERRETKTKLKNSTSEREAEENIAKDRLKTERKEGEQ